MQIKEFHADTLKDCLQQVRDSLGADAVILETRKTRRGGLLGWGARDAVCIVAATGITVKDDLGRTKSAPAREMAGGTNEGVRSVGRAASAVAEMPRPARPEQEEGIVAAGNRALAQNAARGAYARAASTAPARKPPHTPSAPETETERWAEAPVHSRRTPPVPPLPDQPPVAESRSRNLTSPARPEEAEGGRMAGLESAMRDIRDCLTSLQREQKEASERTVTAVVSAVAPAVSAMQTVTQLTGLAEAAEIETRFAPLRDKLLAAGVSATLTDELLDELPDLSAWSAEAQPSLAVSALRDVLARRVRTSGPLALTPGKLKAVALIGPTGVGKTTTIAKLAAHFALVENKRVALLTVDTYRIAAVEQLKIYSQILDLPIGVAYSQAEVLPVVEQYRDFDLLLIDTAGRSQKNIMQVGELKSLLEALDCETHLVLSSQIKEQDMLESARRFSAARVDSLLFTKLDETDSYGTLLNVADKTGIPLSYLTTGQKVPEDIESATPALLSGLLLD